MQPRLHLVFVQKPVKGQILRGEKTCESRISVQRHPARHVTEGDVLLFKCGDAFATARVTRVAVYEDITPEQLDKLAHRYSPSVDGPVFDAPYWAEKRRKARHAVFLDFEDVKEVSIPHYLLPSTQMAWITDYQPAAVTRDLLDEQLCAA